MPGTTFDQKKNHARGTFPGSPGITSAATSLTFASGHGVRFPEVGTGLPYNIEIWSESDFGGDATAAALASALEIARVTAHISGSDTLTIERAKEGTTALNFNTAGKTYRVMMSGTAKIFQDNDTAINSIETFLASGGSPVKQRGLPHIRFAHQFAASGAGTDASPYSAQAIIDAIADVSGTEPVEVICKGVFRASSADGNSIALRDNVTLRGFGGNSNANYTKITVPNDSTGDISIITNADTTNGNKNIKIIDIKVIGNKLNVGDTGSGNATSGITLKKCSDVLIDGVEINNCLNGLNFNNDHTYIPDADGTYPSLNLKITNTRAKSCRWGFEIGYTDGFTADNIVAEDCDVHGTELFCVKNFSLNNWRGLRNGAPGNPTFNTEGDGLAMRGCRDGSVQGGHCHGNGRIGIVCEHFSPTPDAGKPSYNMVCRRISIAGCQANDNRGIPVNSAGFWLEGGVGINIVGCSAKNNHYAGFVNNAINSVSKLASGTNAASGTTLTETGINLKKRHVEIGDWVVNTSLNTLSLVKSITNNDTLEVSTASFFTATNQAYQIYPKFGANQFIGCLADSNGDWVNQPVLNSHDYYTGTTEAGAAGKLQDDQASFATATTPVNSIVYNWTTHSFAYITAVDSTTVLSLSADIASAAGQAYTVIPYWGFGFEISQPSSIIGCRAFNNSCDGFGINDLAGSTNPPLAGSEYIQISNCQAYDNGGCGIIAMRGNVSLSGNFCYDNGRVAAFGTNSGYRDGICAVSKNVALLELSIIGNHCWDSQSTKTQQYGIRTTATGSGTWSRLICNSNNAPTAQHVVGGIVLNNLASGAAMIRNLWNIGQSDHTLIPDTDSTTAFMIQDAARSNNIFRVDTTNKRIGILTAPAYTFDVLGDVRYVGAFNRMKANTVDTGYTAIIETNNSAGYGSKGHAELQFIDNGTLGFRFLAAFGNNGGTYGGFLCYTDRTGAKLPFKIFTSDASANLQLALTVNAGQTAGTAGQTDIAGAVTVGAGTAIKKVLSASATLDFGSTSSGSASDLTITVTGAALGDPVFLGRPDASMPVDGAWFTAWVSAANTVKIRFYNESGQNIDPASGTYRVVVFQF